MLTILCVGNVDDSVVMPALESAGKNETGMTSQSIEHYQPRMYPSTYNLLIPGPHFFNRTVEDKVFPASIFSPLFF